MNEPAWDPWSDFRELTSARIALGRTGGSLPTREILNFGLAHARARDAVMASFDAGELVARLHASGLETRLLRSAVRNRVEYLRRPDLGRQLSDASRAELESMRLNQPFDLCVTVSDGLSTGAVVHAVPVVKALLALLAAEGWNLAPVLVVPFARVAIQDEIGALLNARLSLILLGERPGLGAADSLGAYFVYDPRAGRTDADRNCVSNIRPEGLPPETAVATLHFLLNASRLRGLSGVRLKDERPLTGPDHSPGACLQGSM